MCGDTLVCGNSTLYMLQRWELQVDVYKLCSCVIMQRLVSWSHHNTHIVAEKNSEAILKELQRLQLVVDQLKLDNRKDLDTIDRQASEISELEQSCYNIRDEHGSVAFELERTRAELSAQQARFDQTLAEMQVNSSCSEVIIISCLWRTVHFVVEVALPSSKRKTIVIHLGETSRLLLTENAHQSFTSKPE